MKTELMGQGTYSYTCDKPFCGYCDFIKRQEFIKEKAIKELNYVPPKPRKQRFSRKQWAWGSAEIILLREMVNVPTDELIKNKTFGERTKMSIDARKSMIRKKYKIKPLPRNYRIYHL